MEEIYHKGEEGAGRAGIEGAFLLHCVPASRGSPWRPFVVTILVPGRFAYPVI
ncbi:MAG: hypothetical protein LBH51_07250 [Treponema sp.]|nr:hypothetical protein [Treponema sp.]